MFFDEAFLADDAVAGGVVLGEPEGGWAVAMATAGFERGLTLRSPGRFLATAERLVGLAAERGDATLPSARCHGLDARRRLPAADAGHRTTLAGGAKPGAEASLTKLWWSELDIELHHIAIDLLGPEAELRGPVEQGLAVLASQARSTPAPTRSSATSSPSACWGCRDEVWILRLRTTRCCSATPCATCWPRR